MRKFSASSLVLFAVLLVLPSPVADQHAAASTPELSPDDPRLERLEEFFAARDCPAVAVAGVFVQAADAYGLDWRLLPSISFVESTGGKAMNNNNLFGWKNGEAEFASLSEAIHKVGFSLANSRLYRNKDVDAILETYNPNNEYPAKVKSVMYRISPSR